MKEEKKKAIMKCLTESFPGCRIIKYPNYYTTTYEIARSWGRGRQTPGETFLLIYLERIGDLSVILYEEKEPGIYELFIDNDMNRYNTPVTHHRLSHKTRDDIVDMYKIPRRLGTVSIFKPDVLIQEQKIV